MRFKVIILFCFTLTLSTCRKPEENKQEETSSVKKYLGMWEFTYSWANGQRGPADFHWTENDSICIISNIEQGSSFDRIIIKIPGKETFDLKIEPGGEILNTCKPPQNTSGGSSNCSGYFIGDSILYYEKKFSGGPNLYITNITKLKGEKTDKVFVKKPPSVVSVSVCAITCKGAILKGSVNPNSLPASVIFEYGPSSDYGYQISAQPSAMINAGIYIDVKISAHISGLQPNLDYHGRLIASNSLGTSNSNDISFRTTCETGKVEDIEGNTYGSILIGEQIWTVENLRTNHLNDGTAIPVLTGGNEWSSVSSPACCWFNNDEVLNKITYGALYNWYAVGTGKLCPTGWHVPDTSDWSHLVEYLNDDKYLAERLKSASTQWGPFAGSNETLFNALPGGYRSNAYFIPGTGSWWTSTENNRFPESKQYAEYVNISSYFERSWKTNYTVHKKQDGLSVRCIKDSKD